MRRVGIDTVIIIRAGYKERAIIQSPHPQTSSSHASSPTRISGSCFLISRLKTAMKLFWGTYDPGDWAKSPATAWEINREFMARGV